MDFLKKLACIHPITKKMLVALGLSSTSMESVIIRYCTREAVVLCCRKNTTCFLCVSSLYFKIILLLTD